MKRPWAASALLFAALVFLAAGQSRAADLVFTKVSVNGREGLFLVDTGAPASVIGQTFAARAGIRPARPDPRLGELDAIAGGGGVQAARVAYDVAIKPEAGPLRRLDPAVTDLSRLDAIIGHPMDGILGADYFGRMAVVLDYRTGEARFLEPGTPRPAGPGAPMHILATPYVEATVQKNGRTVRAGFQVDTGSNTAVEFFTPFSRRAFGAVQGRPLPGVAVGGATLGLAAPLDLLVFSGQRLTGLMANFAGDSRPDDAPRDYAGAIGGPAFAGKVLTIDYDRERMWVE